MNASKIIRRLIERVRPPVHPPATPEPATRVELPAWKIDIDILKPVEPGRPPVCVVDFRPRVGRVHTLVMPIRDADAFAASLDDTLTDYHLANRKPESPDDPPGF